MFCSFFKVEGNFARCKNKNDSKTNSNIIQIGSISYSSIPPTNQHPPPQSLSLGRSIVYPHPPLRMAEIRTLNLLPTPRFYFLSAPLKKNPKAPNFVGFFEEKMRTLLGKNMPSLAEGGGGADKKWNVPQAVQCALNETKPTLLRASEFLTSDV